MRGVSGQADPQPATWFTVFSSMFMHGGLLHIGGNMLFLWVFGNNVEDAMGRVKFVVFYLLGGIAAMALQTAVDPNATVPSIGASGAVAAVLGGYLLLYPRAQVLTLIFLVVFFTFIQIPAMFFLVHLVRPAAPVRLPGLRLADRRRRAAWPTSRTSAGSCSGC